MADRSPLAIPIPSDLPGNAGEKRDLHRFFKEIAERFADLESRCGHLEEANGCLQERLAKLEAAHAALKEDFRKHYTYEQTGRVS